MFSKTRGDERPNEVKAAIIVKIENVNSLKLQKKKKILLKGDGSEISVDQCYQLRYKNFNVINYFFLRQKTFHILNRKYSNGEAGVPKILFICN